MRNVSQNGMFLVMGNINTSETFRGGLPPSEQHLSRQLVAGLSSSLPRTWKLEKTEVSARSVTSAVKPDVLLVISEPSGDRAQLAVEVKGEIEPRDVPLIVQQLGMYRFSLESAGNSNVAVLAAAPFIGPQTRELLVSFGISYLDATGNLYLRLDRPALFIERQGARRNPWIKGRTLRTLKGPAAGRVIRALADFRPPYRARDLAQRAETPAGTTAKILSLLDREALIHRASGGKYAGEILSVDWRRLIQRWTQDYNFETSNTTLPYLEPRGLDALLTKLRATSLPHAITGSFASVSVAPIVQPRLMALYVEDIEQAERALGLRPAERGANVLLAEPFDPVVFARAMVRDDVTYAAFTQVAADLLTSPGRGPQEGAALLQWMEENEDAWRQ